MARTGASAARARPAWFYWGVAGASLLWNGYGAFDYTATQLRVPAYMAQFPVEVLLKFEAMPGWATACWAIGVWGSLAGSVLLLARSRWAALAFAGSLVGAVVGIGWQFWRGPPPPVMLAVLVGAVIAGLWWFTMFAARKRWVR